MLLHGLILTDPRRAPENGWLRIASGRIAQAGQGRPPTKPDAGGPGRIICPGFVDAHIHLPQIDSIGCVGMPLLEWLDRVIYPAEIWWGRGGASSMLRTAIRRMLREGTLAFAGYLTSHADAAAEALATLASGTGLPARPRCAAGRVAMDRNAPEDLIAQDRWRAGQSPIPSPIAPEPPHGAGQGSDAHSASGQKRVESSANPRFAVACSEELLAEIGWLAKERARTGDAALIQTHLAESRAEVERVRELFPRDESYTAVYDRAGLLTPRTLLAHCVHLSPQEWALIAERRSVAVHCPAANTFLESGLFDLDAAERAGARLALGSDVAAGADIAMPRVARAMIEVAQVRRMTAADGASVRVPSPAEAWRLITEGNAAAIGWPDQGVIREGASADLLVLRIPEAWVDERLIGRLLYNWSADLIETLIVEGRPVEPTTI